MLAGQRCAFVCVFVSPLLKCAAMWWQCVCVRVCVCVCAFIWQLSLLPAEPCSVPLLLCAAPSTPHQRSPLSSSASVNLQTTHQQMPYKPYSSPPPSSRLLWPRVLEQDVPRLWRLYDLFSHELFASAIISNLCAPINCAASTKTPPPSNTIIRGNRAPLL